MSEIFALPDDLEAAEIYTDLIFERGTALGEAANVAEAAELATAEAFEAMRRAVA